MKGVILMNEPGVQDQTPSVPEASTPKAPVVTAGALLREARMAQGLHIAALAVSLKVPVKKIEALEADRLSELPDLVFVRGLASSICRVLRIAPGPVLERLPASAQPSLGPDATGLNASYRVSGDRSVWPGLERLSRPYAVAILALVLGAVAMAVLPLKAHREATVSPSVDVAATPPPSSLPSAPTVQSASAQQREALAEPAPVVVPSDSPSDVSVKAVVAGSGSRTGVLVLQARGASWVEVIDATGMVQLRKIMSEGEVRGVTAPLPLSVVLGHAEVVAVSVRGAPFEIQGMTKDKVARFEVK
jgi:cytoskeleton protein RodZ